MIQVQVHEQAIKVHACHTGLNVLTAFGSLDVALKCVDRGQHRGTDICTGP
jgi:hypothetical protein